MLGVAPSFWFCKTHVLASRRHCVRAAKELDLKSNGLCPQAAATSRSLPLYTYTATTCQESLALKQAMSSSLHCCFLIRFRINLIWCATACRASTSSAMQGKLSQFLSAVQRNNEPTSVLLFELAMIQWSTLHVFNSSDPSFYFHNILVLETSEVRWYF